MRDAFDASLNKLATILVRGASGPADSYGVANTTLTPVATNVPVRVSLGKGRAREQKAGEKFARNYREVFMRPFVDGGGNALSHDHWLLIDGVYYDIFQIDNPGGLDHHLEVWCELVIP